MSLRYDNTRGEWTADKRPVVYEYSITLRCAVCGRGEVKTGEYRYVEGAAYPEVSVGDWRRIGDPFPGSHTDPLRPAEAIVCGRVCADALVASSLDELFACAS